MNRLALIILILFSSFSFIKCPAIPTGPDITSTVVDSLSAISTEKLAIEGERFFIEEKNDSALAVFTILCGRYPHEPNNPIPAVFAKAFDRYGTILYKRGAYALSMDAYLQGRRIAEQYNINAILPRIYVHIGNLYAACGEYSNAIEFFKKAIDSPDVSKDNYTYHMLLNNFFAAYYLSGDTARARKYLEEYEVSSSNKNDKRKMFDIHLAYGLLKDASSSKAEAREEFRQAIGISRKYGLSPLCDGSAYTYMAASFEKEGKLDSALQCLRLSHNIVTSSGNGRLQVEVLRDLARIFDKKNIPDSAFEYKSRYLNLADSISYQEELNKLKSSQMIYELDERSSTIINLNNQKRTQNKVLCVVAISALLLIALTIWLIRQNRVLSLARADLYERNSRQLLDEIKYKKIISDLQSRLEVCESQEETTPPSDEYAPRKSIVDTDTSERIASDITKYMENSDEYCSPEFCLDKLASSVNSNPRYVSEVINIIFQKNFRTFLNEYRIKKAMLRLEDTEHYGHYTIKAISESVGYKSQATFISVFTKITGLKPGMYQKLALERKHCGQQTL